MKTSEAPIVAVAATTGTAIDARVAPIEPDAAVADAAPMPMAEPAAGVLGELPNHLIWVRAVSGPATRRRRRSEIDRKARTTSGEKWVPAQRVSSARAAASDIAFL